MARISMPVRVVIYREEGLWLARCLELDLLGSGEQEQEAIDMLREAIECQVVSSIRSRNMDNLFRPAEGKYFRMYAEGHEFQAGAFEVGASDDGVNIDASSREYILVPA